MLVRTVSLRKMLLVGVMIELGITLVVYYTHDQWGDVFRYAARYSGRFSFVIYLLCFFSFLTEFKQSFPLIQTKKWMHAFALMHLIHFGFLAMSVYLNDLPIVPIKLTGGFLAYQAIIFYPFFIEKIKWNGFHFIYFYYVGFVMAMTFLARIRGDFEGADPSIFHYIGLVTVGVLFFYAIWHLKRKPKTT